ncbi:MAG: hypothetical protein IT228_09655 [Flavobacteriales bacterium]|nr:hypothetical protein [Flavobacteriales bacterium]MCC6577593.1 hypothetical protein [Flavobacteriales bacterium]NUQ14627.1 hypothetical protein [Flavobacteriales bacterium]
MKRIAILVALLALVGGGWYAWREYHRTAAPTSALEAAETMTAEALLKAYTEDENAANARFNGKVLLVTGTVREVKTPENGLVDVVLETGDPLAGVVCQFAQADVPATLTAGAPARIKGVATGLLMDVVLQRCASVE